MSSDIEGADVYFFGSSGNFFPDSAQHRFEFYALSEFLHSSQGNGAGEDHSAHIAFSEFDQGNPVDLMGFLVDFVHQVGVDEHNAAGFQIEGEPVIRILRQAKEKVDGGGAGVEDFRRVDDDIGFSGTAADLSGISGALNGVHPFKVRRRFGKHMPG